MATGKQPDSIVLLEYASMRIANRCSFVIVATANSERCSSTVFCSPLTRYSLYSLLSSSYCAAGEVSTLCPVSSPASVVITSNQTILVSSSAHVLHKVTYQGKLPLHESIHNNNLNLGLQKYKVEVLAGNSGRAARVDGTPDECCFSSPRGLAVHEADHSCFIVEAQSHAIRKVSFAN